MVAAVAAAAEVAEVAVAMVAAAAGAVAVVAAAVAAAVAAGVCRGAVAGPGAKQARLLGCLMARIAMAGLARLVRSKRFVRAADVAARRDTWPQATLGTCGRRSGKRVVLGRKTNSR